MAETYEAASGISGIDTRMAGRPTVTSAYLLHGDEPALVETGPTTSAEAVGSGLDALGLNPGDLAHIVVTHIHLDRVYGKERLQRLFGPVDPTPSDRIRAVSEGDTIRLGGRSLEVLYTPGHASHHVALVDSLSGAVFTGDALGIHLPDDRVLRPATPPPDIDVELGLESIDRIRKRARSVLLFSHFGPVSEVAELCAIAASRLRKWADIVRDALLETDDLDRIAELLDRRTASEFDGVTPVDPSRYDVLSDMKMNAAGLARYWRKREERQQAVERAQAR